MMIILLYVYERSSWDFVWLFFWFAPNLSFFRRAHTSNVECPLHRQCLKTTIFLSKACIGGDGWSSIAFSSVQRESKPMIHALTRQRIKHKYTSKYSVFDLFHDLFSSLYNKFSSLLFTCLNINSLFV